MDREQQRKEISRKICERCDYFDGHACTVNVTGECNLAKESAESILAMGYGNLKDFAVKLKKRKRKRSTLIYPHEEEVIDIFQIDELLKEYGYEPK